MEIATPAATIYTTLQHDVAEEEEEEEKCPKTYEQQSVLININPTLSLQSTTSQDDELHLSIYSPTLTPTMPLTPPPTSREPYQMPTFLLYQNDSKIEPQEENSASLIEDFGAASTNLPLTPCPICSRKFNSTTFTKHVSICQKTATKRRKVFDSSRQRREGTDLAAYPIPKGYGLPPQPNVLNTKRRDRSNSPLQASDMKTPLVTRKKSVGNNMQTTISTNDELIRSTVRSSMSSKVKGSTTGANNNTMSNSTTDGSNFVRDRMRSSERVNAKRSLATQSDQCPHCDRCFGLKAFDRHVEWCKEKALQAAIKTPLKSEPNAAMERLQARTKYRAPCLKTKRTVTRDKYSGMNSEDNGTSIDGLKNKEELAIISTNNAPTSNKTIRDCPSNNNSSIMSQSMTSSILSESGGLHVDKYDPFLSAKRQLEELCSPTDTDMALPTLPTLTSSFCINNKKPTSASTPTTPALPKKSMTMSLNYGSAAIPSTNDTNMHQNTRQILTKTPTPTVTNNFRRTSSLRGPRRSPLLTTRPLFVHNYRPTIQRGLSDEGPISTNFLKPEEYDEMPVRSVCVNDFALTKSPRVVRRDLNAITNRKQNMKLNLHNKNNTNPITTSTTTGSILEDNKELSKTDSLAVFLKYEKDLERELTAKLEKLQQDNAMKAASLEFPDINTNTLSKPNAFNGLRLEPLLNTQTESAKKDLLLLTPITTTKTTTTTTEEPATTTIRANKEPLEKLNDDEKIINVKPQAVINLDIIFNKPQQQKHHHEKEQQQEHHHEKEEEEQVQEQEQSAEIRDTYKLASSTENIDPKLINKFDNLPLNTKLLRPLDDNQVKYSLQQNNNNKSNKRPPTPPPRKTQHSESKIFNDNHNKNNNDYLKKILKNTSVTPPTNLPANTTGGFSLLKRKLRLDRNQFLYDDGVNSAEEKTDFSHNSQLDQNIASNNPIMPVFDDFNFDFEEFLSSFEHDDEQFPLFKDCKEFLSNRITNKQRASVSTQNTIYTPTSSSIISYVKFPQLINNNYFESQHSPCATEEIKRNYNNNRMEVGAIGNSSTAATTNSDGDGEIFISIEAEQSDSGKSPISPASLRNMVGNSQTVVEIHEVGAINDTKFSKISDNDDYDDHNNNNKDIGDSFTKKRPNVQFNNAKNLTQIKQHPNKNIIRPSGDANEDSDDINSSSTITTITTTTRPIRRTLNHKNSSESFNRSIESSTPVPRGLVNLTRPATATGNLPIAQPTIIQQSQNVQQQQFYKTKGQKSRSNQCVYKDMISSSSSSETSLPPIDFHNKNFHMPHVINNNNNNNNNYSTQHQQELFTSYGKKISSQNSSNNNNNSTSHSRRGSNSRINQSSMETNNSNHNHESHVMMMMMNQNEPNNNNNNATYINSMTSASNNNLELTGMHSSTTSSNPSMTSSACKRMSKFCHECGSKFIVEQAKFCMDCGVKRIIL